ncbi:SAM-dependent methyltransferase [Luteolibacter sp. AS25]|uniref:SAM-dependent methyltransferase n=1 Tax=Luteolibacter sp. AS25 TaxID=3135776 RepID=UPI00398A5ACE
MDMETIEQFMARALHHPEKGYYARNIRSIGSRGDFTTTPQISDVPAKAIASWAARAMRKYRTWNLIEVGPGLGTLASQVYRNLPLFTRIRTKLHLVESSPSLGSHQRDHLGKRATYHSTIHEALKACQGNAIIYSNELVDAFPAQVYEKTQSGWQQVALQNDGDFVREIFLPTDELPSSSIFTESYKIGQRVEVHESYHKWLKTWLPTWTNGEMLTIDYGDTAENLYKRKPNGSLRAYFYHNLLEGPAVFQNPGHQDITADVNFSDLHEWSDPWLHSALSGKFSMFIEPYISPETHHLYAAANFFSFIIQGTRNGPEQK